MINAMIGGMCFTLPVSAYDAIMAGLDTPMTVAPLTPQEFKEVYPFETEAQARLVCRHWEYVYGGRQGNRSRYRTEPHWDMSKEREEIMLTQEKREQAKVEVAKANPTWTRMQVMDAVARIPTDYSYAFEPGSESKERAKERHMIAVKWWLFRNNLGPEPDQPIPPFEHPSGVTAKKRDASTVASGGRVHRVTSGGGTKHVKGTLAPESTMKGKAARLMLREGGATAEEIMAALNCTLPAAQAHISDVRNNMGLKCEKRDGRHWAVAQS